MKLNATLDDIDNGHDLTRQMRRRMDCNRCCRQLMYYLQEYFGRLKVRRGVEVGVERGRTLTALLTAFPNLSIEAIDFWRENPGVHAANQHEHDDNLTQTLFRIQRFSDRVNLHVCDQVEGYARIAGGPKYDFVFLDADHRYEGTREAIGMFSFMVRPGGMICGDDYNSRAEQVGAWGVKRAVDEFAECGDHELRNDGRFWWIIKPGGYSG